MTNEPVDTGYRIKREKAPDILYNRVIMCASI